MAANPHYVSYIVRGCEPDSISSSAQHEKVSDNTKAFNDIIKKAQENRLKHNK